MHAQIRSEGPTPARVMVIGEAPSTTEVSAGRAFAGAAGKELTNMLHEAGILYTESFVTSVVRVLPPHGKPEKCFTKNTPQNRTGGPEIYAHLDLLREEIEQVKPNVIIALGEIALWILTNEKGITKWRGSILESKLIPGYKVVPTYSPHKILNKWDWRFIAVQDLRRAEKESHWPEIRYPGYEFIIRPDFTTAMQAMDKCLGMAAVSATSGNVATCGPVDREPRGVVPGHVLAPHMDSNQSDHIFLSVDVETRAGYIACVGIGWSETEAICIPFLSVHRPDGYWTFEEEQAIVLKLRELFLHPNIRWILQNGLYDYQYFASNWGFLPQLGMDTMLAQHTCFAGLPKGLDFISSLYCKYHRYWKDEGKEYHTSIKTPEEEDKYWMYNCKDAVATFECASTLGQVVIDLKQEEPYLFQLAQFLPVLKMMLRGVRINQEAREELAKKLFEGMYEREVWMQQVVGYVLNPRSPKQMQNFFYKELGLPPQRNRKTGKPTLDDNALDVLGKKEPLIRPLVEVIQEYRSLGVFLSTFVKSSISPDGRARSSYNIAGTETFRWSSSKDAFGDGMNLQNIPKGTEK